MVTTQLEGTPDDADLSRADSLAREIFSDVANKWAFLTLTEPGQALRATVDGMCVWTHQFFGQIQAARHRFDA
jgi:DNA-binding HxlR family transcriptional regulator